MIQLVTFSYRCEDLTTIFVFAWPMISVKYIILQSSGGCTTFEIVIINLANKMSSFEDYNHGCDASCKAVHGLPGSIEWFYVR